MDARKKLYVASLNGSIVLAAAIGYLPGSSTPSILAFSLLLATSHITGDMRLRPKR